MKEISNRQRNALKLLVLLSGLLPLMMEARVEGEVDPEALKKQVEREAKYYRLTSFPLPSELKLEASGLAVLPDGRLGVAIRKGEIWILENPLRPSTDGEAGQYQWKRFASGLHEPLGLAWKDGAFYTTQRSEVTRVADRDGDGVADEYLTAAKGWGVSGNYHEYAYGPVFDPKGNLWITLNINIGGGQKFSGNAEAETFRWRGWSMRQGEDGVLKPVSAGLRSPLGLGTNAGGDVFATDQQGNWWPTNPLIHLQDGVFHGHADSLRDVERPESSLKDPRPIPKGLTIAEAIREVKGYAPPAVWFPYGKIGMSTTGIRMDSTEGGFGPFSEQLFVGEFTMAGINRVDLEKVKGQYQGACFRFRYGMQSAVLQMAFLPDGSMAVGESNRGWNSLGSRSYGLERLVWTGEMPFEILRMRVKPDGFELHFTETADPETARQLSSYRMSSYTYHYQSAYGSEEIDTKPVQVEGVELLPDGRGVRLRCSGLREGYVHELHADGLRNASGESLLHPEAFYTLNALPDGAE